MRFFAALENGVVVGTRKTSRTYTHAVLHQGARARQTFATFHSSETHAMTYGVTQHVTTAPRKVIVRTIETSTLVRLGANLSVGAVLQP